MRCTALAIAMMLGCSGGDDSAGREPADPADNPRVSEQPTRPARRMRPTTPDVPPLSSEFCARYAEARDAERLFGLGDGDVEEASVDQVISEFMQLAEEAPSGLNDALRNSAAIYQQEKARILGDEISDIMYERRSFDDERDLILQITLIQSYVDAGGCEIDGASGVDG